MVIKANVLGSQDFFSIIVANSLVLISVILGPEVTDAAMIVAG